VIHTPVKRRLSPALLFGLMVAATGLSGCGDFRNALGYDKKPPDEFAVVSRAPLSVPPNFQLRPPEPGAQRPQEPSKRHGARNLIIKNASGTTPSATATAGDNTIRKLLRTEQVEPGIRELVNRETAAYVYADKYLIDKILFWKPEPVKGVVVDADKEKRRLQENAALGKQVTDGETPTIKRKRGGLLDGLF
jgi:hypothetical protein